MAATATVDKPRAKPAKAPAKAPAAAKDATPKVSKAEKAAKAKLNQVGTKGKRYEKVRSDVLSIRGQLDAAILAARLAGASYKDIATAAGVSVSWVQTSLGRSGYQPEGRVRSANNGA